MEKKKEGGGSGPAGAQGIRAVHSEGGGAAQGRLFVGRSSSRDGMPKGSLSVLVVGREEVRMGQARDVLRALSEPRLVVAEARAAEAATLTAEADVAMMVFGGDEEEGL